MSACDNLPAPPINSAKNRLTEAALQQLSDPEPPFHQSLNVMTLLLAGVLIVRECLIRSEGDQRAKVILAGAAQSRAACDTEATDDPGLRDDETEAGRVWARSHRSTDPSECPRHSLALPLLRTGAQDDREVSTGTSKEWRCRSGPCPMSPTKTAAYASAAPGLDNDETGANAPLT
jgi:hypothetical protein